MRMLVLAFVALLLFGGAGRAAEARKPVVVASTTQIADFARQVVGDRCEVLCILAPGEDPHTREPAPGDIAKVRRADLCLENGMHLEGKNWMRTLAKNAGKPLITCTDGIEPISLEEEGRTFSDPHAWFTCANAAVYVNNILAGLERVAPAHKAEFRARAKLYLQQLRVLDNWMREQIARIPAQRRVLVTNHDAFNYFCREYKFNPQHDYRSLAPIGWSTGAEVGGGISPERRRQVIEGLRQTGTPAVFVETSLNPEVLREIAREAGIEIGGALYSDSMGPAGSAGETYIGMMRENVLLIVGALAEE